MTYDELIKRKDEIVAAISELKEAEKEVNCKIENAKHSKAYSIFETILVELREMAELGFTITILTEDAEWGGENWHELGLSLREIAFTETDQQEAIYSVLDGGNY